MSDELPDGYAWEWGVKHSQGIRRETSERAARESLTWLTAAHERNSRIKTAPVIVRRVVSEWQEVTP